MRVFILGAGFSCGLGYPLEKQLVDEILRYWNSRRKPDHIKALNGLRKTLANFDQRKEEAVGIEELFEFITTVIVPFLSLRHQQDPDPVVLSGPLRVREQTTDMMREAIRAVAAVLCGYAQNETLSPVDRFAESMADDDVVITLNYDTAVERALLRCGRTPDFGFRGTDDATATPGHTRVLKLHGSIDWTATCPTQQWDNTSGFRLLYGGPHVDGDDDDYRRTLDPSDLACLWGIDGQKHLDALAEGTLCDTRGTLLLPALAGLGLEKNPATIPGMGHVHALAHWCLRRADSVVVVGYSFPATDRYISYLFRTAFQRSMRNGGPRLRIVDPNPQAAHRNTRVAVQECVLDARRMEDITDWRAL